MFRCWAQEPDQRPTFYNIQDQLQLFRNVSLNNVSHCGQAAPAGGVINKGFEGKLLQNLGLQCFSQGYNGMNLQSRYFRVGNNNHMLATSLSCLLCISLENALYCVLKFKKEIMLV